MRLTHTEVQPGNAHTPAMPPAWHPAAACTKEMYDRGAGTLPVGCPSDKPELFSGL